MATDTVPPEDQPLEKESSDSIKLEEKATSPPAPEVVYGVKLLSLMVAITLAVFVMMLDTSIIATVKALSYYPPVLRGIIFDFVDGANNWVNFLSPFCRPFLGLRPISILWLTWDGMVVHIRLQSKSTPPYECEVFPEGTG